MQVNQQRQQVAQSVDKTGRSAANGGSGAGGRVGVAEGWRG